MTVKKLLLKNENGAPIAVLTLKREERKTFLTLPQETTFLAAMASGRLLDRAETKGGFALSCGDSPLSLLIKRGDETLFATEENDAAYAKWTMLSLQEKTPQDERKSELTPPTSEEEAPPVFRQEAALTGNTEAETPAGKIEDENGISSEASDIPEEKTISEEALSEGEIEAQGSDESEPDGLFALFEKGEPFTIFEEMIKGSRWVRLSEEKLLGRITIDGEEKLLCGVAGRRGAAPDETHEWTFLPSEEDEEEGYYIRSATEKELFATYDDRLSQ